MPILKLDELNAGKAYQLMEEASNKWAECEEKEIILELPNLDSLEDSVDDYIKQILEKQEDIDLSNLIDEEEEKKKLL